MNSMSHPQLTAFTAQDEERELISMTPEEIVEAEFDLQGLAAAAPPSAVRGGATTGREELVSRAGLSELDAEVGKISERDRAALLEAERRRPDLVDDGHRRAFLWREGFNPELAARRLVNYWEYKRELFGPEKCFLPLTLHSLRDDAVALSHCPYRLLPVRDEAGRVVLLYDPSRLDHNAHSRESMLRVVWYILQVASEDPAVQELGVVILVCAKYASLRNFDPLLSAGMSALEAKYLPVRFRSMHLCYPPAFFRLVLPIIKFIMGKRIRNRLRVHYGDVLEGLSRYGLPRERVPSELGGDLTFDYGKWLYDRLMEESDSCIQGQGLPPGDASSPSPVAVALAPAVVRGEGDEISAATHGAIQSLQRCISSVSTATCPSPQLQTDNFASECGSICNGEEGISINGGVERAAKRVKTAQRPLQDAFAEMDAALASVPIHTHGINDPGTVDSSSSGIDVAQTSKTDPELGPLPPSGQLACPEKNSSSISDELESDETHPIDNPTATKPPGSEGETPESGTQTLAAADGATDLGPLPPFPKQADPRMNRAVMAKLSNPGISNLEALLIGGFSYPSLAEPKLYVDSEIFDDENTSLSQRKNQLARRIRNIKKARAKGCGVPAQK